MNILGADRYPHLELREEEEENDTNWGPRPRRDCLSGERDLKWYVFNGEKERGPDKVERASAKGVKFQRSWGDIQSPFEGDPSPPFY